MGVMGGESLSWAVAKGKGGPGHTENYKNIAVVPKVTLFCFSNISATLSLHFSAST